MAVFVFEMADNDINTDVMWPYIKISPGFFTDAATVNSSSSHTSTNQRDFEMADPAILVSWNSSASLRGYSLYQESLLKVELWLEKQNSLQERRSVSEGGNVDLQDLELQMAKKRPTSKERKADKPVKEDEIIMNVGAWIDRKR